MDIPIPQHTDRLLFRPLDLRDAPLLDQILGDADTMRHYPAPIPPAAVRNWIQRSVDSYAKHGFGLWALVLKESGALIGQCGISMQHIDGEQLPEIGYHVDKAHWNRGLATEAAMACLDFGLNELQLPGIYIHTYVQNLPSQRVALKIGMEEWKTYPKRLKGFDLVWDHVVFRKEAR